MFLSEFLLSRYSSTLWYGVFIEPIQTMEKGFLLKGVSNWKLEDYLNSQTFLYLPLANPRLLYVCIILSPKLIADALDYLCEKNNLAGMVFLQGEKSWNHETKEKSDEVDGFIGFFFGQTYTDVMCYGTYSNANSAFLRLSSMACRLPL